MDPGPPGVLDRVPGRVDVRDMGARQARDHRSLTVREIACTASKSPGEVIGNPASITSTPRRASCWAISSFSCVFSEIPGDCSPSRSVVSKISTGWDCQAVALSLLLISVSLLLGAGFAATCGRPRAIPPEGGGEEVGDRGGAPFREEAYQASFGMICAVRRLALIVNPVAGGAGPRGRCRTSRQRSAHGASSTLRATPEPRARPRARAGSGRGRRGRGGVRGRRIRRRRRRRGLRDPTASLGVLPGGRGNDFAARSGCRASPSRPARCWPPGRSVARSRRGRRADVHRASPAAGLTRSSTGSPTRPGSCAAASSTPTALSGRCLAGSRPGSRSRSTAARRAFTRLLGGRRQLARLRWRDAARAGRLADDGLLDVVIIADCSRLSYLRLLPTVFNGRHVRQRASMSLRGTRGARSAPSRPFTLYADGDPIAELPVTIRVLPARGPGDRAAA